MAVRRSDLTTPLAAGEHGAMGCRPFSWTWFGAGFLVSFAASAQGAPPPGATFPPLPAGSAAVPPAAPPGSAPPAPPAPVAPAAVAPAAPVAPTAVAPAAPAPAGYPPPVYPPPAAVPQPAGAPFVASNSYAFAPRPRLVWPEDAAVQSSPFMDATISLISLEDRFFDPLVVGVGFGAYLGRLVRVVARLEMPSTSDGEQYYDGGYTPGYAPRDTGAVTLLYGGSVGIVAAHSVAFVFSPGVTFLRTDVSGYGSMLGVAIPFEWTTSKGLRFGLEVGVGRAFGGSQEYECTFGPNCVVGETKEEDRDDARALTLRFELGFGFNHPPPETSPPGRAPEPSPEPWPYQRPGSALPPPAFQGPPPATTPAPAPAATPGF
jgi:hypothetical protein